MPPLVEPSAVGVFAPGAEGEIGFLEVPFPSDLYLGADGTVEVGVPEGAPAAVGSALAMLGDRRGMCRSCAIAFGIDGALDAESVPGDAGMGDAASASDAIVLVREDGMGEAIPLLVDYDAIDSRIVVRPRWGMLLAPETTYVAALTDAIHAEDGTPLGASPLFAAIRDGGGVTGAEVERARQHVERALDALVLRGVARERVVAAALFTTGDGAEHLRALKSVAAAAEAPIATIDRVYRASDGDLDVLLGMPSEDRPGVDIPPADGMGTAAVVHDAMAFVLLGTFDSPRVVEGAGPNIGELRRDAAGAPVAGPEAERVPFVLIVPDRPDLASLPVVIAQHGLPATKRFGLEVGNTFARQGMAVLAVDMFLMGARAASAVDEVSDLRGLAVPDGLHEHNDIGVNLAVLGVGGAEPGREADPTYHFATASQMIVDLLSTVRFLRDGNADAMRAADPALATLSFDRDHVFYVGESYGGYLGTSALPILEGVSAMALVVGGPDAFDALVSSPHNRPSIEIVTTAYLGLRNPWESAGRRLTMSPVLNLWRWAFEPVSGANAIHYAFDAPIGTAEPPDTLFIYTDCDEFTGSAGGEHALGLAGVPVGGEPGRLVAFPPLAAPLSANRVTTNGTVTAAGFVYAANHAVLRLRTVNVEHEKPIEPPFTLLAEPRAIDNPIEEAHAQIAELFSSRMTGGRAVVIDPFAR